MSSRSPNEARSGFTASKPILAGGLVLLVLIFAVKAAFPDVKDLELSFADGAPALKLTRGDASVEFVTILDDVFQDQARKATVQAWLRGQGFFHVSERALADTLAAILPYPRLSSLAQIESATARIDEEPLLKDLRERAAELSPPFQAVGNPETAEIPAPAARPPQFRVWVPRNSLYEGKVVEISNPTLDRYLVLLAQGRMNSHARADFHLNKKQIEFLFEDTDRSEYQVVVVLDGGQQLSDPTGEVESPRNVSESLPGLASSGAR